jgi:hypothetical protein
MRWGVVLAVTAAACGPKSTPTSAPPRPSAAGDPREAHLTVMADLLGDLTAEIARITAAPPSSARCDELSAALVAWGEAHYEAYEVADAEGTYLGLTDADADDAELRLLARRLAWSSSQLVELVDEDCLYGDGAYGEALYDFLVAYQGLAHWVRDGDPAAWDYETLIAEVDR